MLYRLDVPTTIESELDARRNAEVSIVDILREERRPLRMSEILDRVLRRNSADSGTARRAVLRLAASGRAVVDSDFNVSLGQ